MARSRSRSSPGIKAFFTRQRLLMARGIPMSLKLQLMGHGQRGGYLSRLSRMRRKIPKQLKGIPTSYSRLTENGA